MLHAATGTVTAQLAQGIDYLLVELQRGSSAISWVCVPPAIYEVADPTGAGFAGGCYSQGNTLSLQIFALNGNPSPTTVPITADAAYNQDTGVTTNVTFDPVPNPQEAPSQDPDPCPVQGNAGSPINVTNGNTWIPQVDYSMPGVAGGFSLTRTWNSFWPLMAPPEEAGIFGDSWRSSVEERIQVLTGGVVKSGVPTLRKFSFGLLLIWALGFNAMAQSLTASGDKISLPDGDVIGAAFDDGASTLIAQQSVISTENGGLVFRSHLVLTSWSIKSHLQLTKQEFPLRPVGSSTHPCGRVDVVSSLGRVYLCSAETRLDVLDAKSLARIGGTATEVNQHIYDFAIDEQRSKIFVLSLRSDMSVKLAAYAMSDGSALQEITLSQTAWSGAKLSVEPKTGQVAVADSQETGHRYASNISLCESAATLTCSNLGKVDPVSQMTFLGRDLLFATSNPANDKKDCIGSLDVSTRTISHDYCSPSTGVHFAVGVILKRYVVGFTGTTKTHAFLERNSSIQSSVSIWRAENPKVEAVVNDPTDYGASQYELRIAASKTTPMFLTYAWRSNALYLYTIKDAG